jgi:hypothetical protein
MTVSWTDATAIGRVSAWARYPNIEGITHQSDGILYMACVSRVVGRSLPWIWAISLTLRRRQAKEI